MQQTTKKQNTFGSEMFERVWIRSSKNYRYGFSFAELGKASVNGKEKDSETANDDYDFGARIYDARLGRWIIMDSFGIEYVSFSSCFNIANFNGAKYI